MPCRVDRLNGAPLVDGDDAVHRCFDDRFEVRRRFHHRPLRLFDDRDVSVDFQNHVADRSDDSLHAAQYRYLGAALPHMHQSAVPFPFIINFFLDVEPRHRISGFEQLVNRTTDSFCGGVAIELFSSLIPVLNGTAGSARNDNSIERQVQQSRLFFALFLRALALRNVAGNGGYADDIAMRHHRRKRQHGIKATAVLAHACGLELRYRLAAHDRLN